MSQSLKQKLILWSVAGTVLIISCLISSDSATKAQVPTTYGVSVNDSTGELSGYAWSEVVGWISFNKSELTGCPTTPCEAKINNFSERPFTTAKSLSGWIKILSNTEKPWIHLAGTAQDGKNYGAVLHSDGSISGYAWSEAYGWISFEGVPYKVTVSGITNMQPLTIRGAGFKPGLSGEAPLITLINTKDNIITKIDCLDENNQNTFQVGSGGTMLTGYCPIMKGFVGEWDVQVTNPNYQKARLSQFQPNKSFIITSPTDSGFTVTLAGAPTQGPNTITKITSSNSLMGAYLQLVKDNEIVPCFRIYEYDDTKGWNAGKNESGYLPQICDLTGKETGEWKFMVTKGDWNEFATNTLNLSCTHTSWTPANISELCGTVAQTDNCGNSQTVLGSVTCAAPKICNNETNLCACPATGCQTPCTVQWKNPTDSQITSMCGQITQYTNCGSSLKTGGLTCTGASECDLATNACKCTRLLNEAIQCGIDSCGESHGLCPGESNPPSNTDTQACISGICKTCLSPYETCKDKTQNAVVNNNCGIKTCFCSNWFPKSNKCIGSVWSFK